MIFIYFGKLTVTEGREESGDKEKFKANQYCDLAMMLSQS
jgi:hypothetical protein